MIDRLALDDIRRDAARAYPDECCGALIGRADRIEEAMTLPNTTEGGARRRFLVRPEDYRSAERRATRVDRELLGFYHSHPDHEARPSAFDLAHAWPNLVYLIVTATATGSGTLACWRLREDRSQFDEAPCVTEVVSDGTLASTAVPVRPTRSTCRTRS